MQRRLGTITQVEEDSAISTRVSPPMRERQVELSISQNVPLSFPCRINQPHGDQAEPGQVECLLPSTGPQPC